MSERTEAIAVGVGLALAAALYAAAMIGPLFWGPSC
ncbi:hypothetical protein SEA_OSCAR_84 [Mycobacterium phage Oscar]|nr:hypothetical protein SEA_OSCAR_84 [Mycobacterium phage Oscar]